MPGRFTRIPDGANKSSKELVAEFRHDFAIGRIRL